MENKYVILARYQHWTGQDGVQFSDWFVTDSTPRTKEDAEEKIEEIKKTFQYIDKVTKLKHEYDLKLHSEYLQDLQDQKNRAEELAKKSKEYYKSEEYKELLKKKRQSAKELKERQRKYAEEHGL